MGPLTSGSVEAYMQGLIQPRDAVLAEMEEFAKQNRVPIVGPLVGRVLYQLARLVDAGRIFEMGSAIGYSTIWFARAFADDRYYSTVSPLRDGLAIGLRVR